MLAEEIKKIRVYGGEMKTDKCYMKQTSLIFINFTLKGIDTSICKKLFHPVLCKKVLPGKRQTLLSRKLCLDLILDFQKRTLKYTSTFQKNHYPGKKSKICALQNSLLKLFCKSY